MQQPPHDQDTATMRAIGITAFGGPEVLQPVTVPRPQPLPGDILVRVHAAGVNPVDWKTRAGAPTPAAAALGPAPHILGWDVSGVVEQVGPGVHLFAPGDEVYGLPWFPRPAGAYAEYVIAPARQFAPKPSSLDHVHAAAIPLAGLTALHALTDAGNVQAGDRVLIHAAAGGVGHLAVQIAKHLGAHVIGTARAHRHDLLRRLGADEVIDYSTQRFEQVVTDVDVVVDLVGDAVDQTSTRSLAVLRPGGTFIQVAPRVSPELPRLAADREIRVTPAILVDADGPGLRRLGALADSGNLSVLVEKVFPLEDAAEAHRLGETDHVAGKLVLQVA
ncbi:NADPH:quinone reductase-like Zn-dependent oxidoreductase [Actinoplanes lutulentus]|uniref:NADPH:quinone reductase-like Zn-dependent oxidoreductase n=1 Tax=Actinoplanes lutulentus TaxID=1287878 RepID=A0A327Z271_9ACTN|nr:NADP-dependent oxidoreductase [Actinoplanes lutulentus]MBB2946358.1 NADPH:quinone reductase-like Zn-dependent oxidoreductase [Actinoplanes lutulentus]RAK28702.1 NADPH:quinone reductase-like Zn-dependent oxidoreductase [Actinoplanes lutulentus]